MGYIICLIVGCILGAMMMCLLQASSRANILEKTEYLKRVKRTNKKRKIRI